MNLDIITTKEFNGRVINFYVNVTKEFYSEYYLKSSDVRALLNLRKADTGNEFYKATDLLKLMKKSPMSEQKKQAVIDFIFEAHSDIRDNYMNYLSALTKRLEKRIAELQAECEKYESSLEFAIGEAVSKYYHKSPKELLRRLINGD